MRSFSKREALAAGWERFKERPFFLIGLLLITTIISAITGFFADEVATGLGGVIFGLLDTVVQIVLGMGTILIALRVYDKVDTDYGDLIEPLHLFWKYLGASILVFVVVMIGLLLLVVPGIVAGIALMFATYLVIDRNLGPVQAITDSLHMTHGHRWNLFIFGLVLFLFNILGAMFFGIGLLVTIPVSLLATVHVYRWLLNPNEEEGIEVSTFVKVVSAVFVGMLFLALALVVFLVVSSTVLIDSPEVRDVQRQSDLLEIKLGAALYKDINGTFPPSVEAMVPEYMDYIPLDPSTQSPYEYYLYGEGDDYEVCTVLEVVEEEGLDSTYCEFGLDLESENIEFGEELDDFFEGFDDI